MTLGQLDHGQDIGGDGGMDPPLGHVGNHGGSFVWRQNLPDLTSCNGKEFLQDLDAQTALAGMPKLG